MNGIGIRESLLSKLSSMRMGRMMDALKINKERYLHSESIIEINSHINRCNECVNITECDDKLDNQKINSGSAIADGINPAGIKSSDIGFCNNEE